MSARNTNNDPTKRARNNQKTENQLVTPASANAEGYYWKRQSVQETFTRIQADLDHPWLAIGNFLDDWRFTKPVDRADLARESIVTVDGSNFELLRWAAFCAAMVEWL
ncbi:MAG: hypothetical protein ACRDHE_01480, partial [Ktedonobacterales bacterium]